MYKFQIIIQNPPEGFTERKFKEESFQAPPHVGEYLAVPDDAGQPQGFVVKAVVHGANGKANLFVEHVGTEAEMMEKLLLPR